MGGLVTIAVTQSNTQPSGPQLVIRTENGLWVTGITGVNSGACRITSCTAAVSCSCCRRDQSPGIIRRPIEASGTVRDGIMICKP